MTVLGPQTALLIIDVQVGLISGAHAEADVLAAVNRCASKVRQAQGSVVFIQHCHTSYQPMTKGQPGWQLHPDLDRAEGDWVVEKQASDAFYQTDLHQGLQSRGIQQLLISGLQTEFCVDTTCRAAISLGYTTTLISDGHTTGDSLLPAATIIAHHNRTLSELAHPHGGARLLTSHEC